MTSKSFLLILSRQITSKWGRTLLASCGIMIGIWAITLTSSISIGLSDTIIEAINSQSIAKQITLNKTSAGEGSFFDLKAPPVFVPFSREEISSIKTKYPEIVDIGPTSRMNFFVQTNSNTLEQIKCVEFENSINLSITPQSPKPKLEDTNKLASNCKNISHSFTGFEEFYDAKKKNWYGQKSKPAIGEIALCFKCGNTNLNQILKVEKPEDLLNKQIQIELQRAPELYEIGKNVDVTNIDRPATKINKSETITLKVVSVIDDREASIFDGSAIYFDYNYFQKAFELARPNDNFLQYGSIQYNVFLDKYQSLDKTINSLRGDKLLAFSVAQETIKGVSVAFQVLTVGLSALGFIALIVSVFGIINVMTISVLERQKEIGILKSLGARNLDIFVMFLLESSILGLIGWILGTLLAFLSNLAISKVFKLVLENNKDLNSSLTGLNITQFNPSIPIWLGFGTLILALFFTIISGIYPSFKASRQNPVDVLRSE